MGYGDWGLGIGDWGLGIGPNRQWRMSSSQSPIQNKKKKKKKKNKLNKNKKNLNYYSNIFFKNKYV